MPINPKTLRDLPPKQKAYWTKAQEFLNKSGTDWISVEVGSAEYYDWVRYFRHLGFKPQMISLAEKQRIESLMVPARLPQHFDTGFDNERELPPFPGEGHAFVQPVHPNLFVGRGRPGYDRVLEFVRDATQNFWRHKPSGRRVHRDDEYLSDEARLLEGYWVPESWYASGRSYKDWHLRLIKNPGFRKWDNAEKRRANKPAMTDEEKAAFIEDAKRIGGEIKGMTLSDEARCRGEKTA